MMPPIESQAQRDAMIADCKADIADITKAIDELRNSGNGNSSILKILNSSLLRQQIALAALEADGQELARKVWSDLDRMASPEPYMRKAYESVMQNYTTPPVPELKTVVLPNCVDDLHGVGPVMSAEEVEKALREAGYPIQGGGE